MSRNKKQKASKRNRHTGVINAFKRNILETGQRFDLPDRTWFAKHMKPELPGVNSITIVRV